MCTIFLFFSFSLCNSDAKKSLQESGVYDKYIKKAFKQDFGDAISGEKKLSRTMSENQALENNVAFHSIQTKDEILTAMNYKNPSALRIIENPISAGAASFNTATGKITLNQIPESKEELIAMIILPECTYMNDCIVVDLKEDEQFIIEK